MSLVGFLLGLVVFAFAAGLAVGYLLRPDRLLLWAASALVALSLLLMSGPFWT